MSASSKQKRPRGLPNYYPQASRRVLLADAIAVLDTYREHLPLTVRQIFYRLVAEHGYEKSENTYDKVGDSLNLARRAPNWPQIDFDAIRDDGSVHLQPNTFDGLPQLWQAFRYTADRYRRDLLQTQDVALELWVEAAGMAPQVAKVADPYCIPVYSSGGFHSVTVKYQAARRILNRWVTEDRPTVVMHVGDHDPSGVAIFESAAEDITAMIVDLGGEQTAADFNRIALTPDQIRQYELAESPAKKTDDRGDWEGGTAQLEALSPRELANELGAAIGARIDNGALDEMRATEEHERNQATTHIAGVKQP